MAEPPEAYSFKPADDKPALDNSWGNNDSGVASYTNGDTYTGDYKDGKKHGQGVYVYANGDEFKGTYVEDERDGLGLFTCAAGGKYHGNYSKGKRHGGGTYFYANGDAYCGQWQEGLKHGKGIYGFAAPLNRRATYSGEWNQGQIVSGKYVLGDKVYEGAFANQKPVGEGVWLLGGCKVQGKHDQRPLTVDGAPDEGSEVPRQVDVTWTATALTA